MAREWGVFSVDNVGLVKIIKKNRLQKLFYAVLCVDKIQDKAGIKAV